MLEHGQQYDQKNTIVINQIDLILEKNSNRSNALTFCHLLLA